MRTAHPTAASRLPVTFGQPSRAAVADRHARAFMAWFWRRRRGRWLTPGENVLLAMVVGVVIGVLAAPLVLAGLVLMVGQVAWVTVRRTRTLARSVAAEPGAHEPTTVTIDDAGVGVVGPTVAQRHGWGELGGASIRRGFLVLEDRTGSPVEIVCLDQLGPAVDEVALLAEVRRRLG